MPGGYHGRYLRIDVTTGRSRWIDLPEPVLRRFLGGVGLGTWLLLRESPPQVDPFAAEAPLIFCFSPLVGTPLTTSAKFAILAKSPLTNRLNDALSSSHFALAGKRTGADALVLVGACTRPSLLRIDNDQVQLEDASRLWGLSGPETTRQLGDVAAAVIGPAGEHRVRYATLSHANRHAGRGGLGAVLGSKNLKAVVVNGTRRTALAHPEAVARAAKELSRRSFGPATAKYRELGTVANLLTFNRLDALPTRNFQSGHFEQAEQISGEVLNEARHMARESCAACTIGCEHIFATGDGQRVRLEYESLFALGSLCGIGDREVILQAARRCDELGLDTISAGATIAFAMECAERGWIDAPQLRFGAGDALLSLIDRIAYRSDPLGDLLAEGSRRAAEMIGGEAPRFAPHVKGLEIPGYEPRTMQTMALGFAVGSRGADHNRSGAYEADFSTRTDRLHGTSEAARLAIETEDRAALIDSLILCKFLRGVFVDLYAESAELLHAVTGWDISAEELRQTAKRIIDAKKWFNQRQGWTREEDKLPARFFEEGLTMQNGSVAQLDREQLEAMIAAYYQGRGWDQEGRLTDEIEFTRSL